MRDKKGSVGMTSSYDVKNNESRAKLVQRYRHLTETIALIERNLSSGRIYPPDECEIKESRDLFLKEKEAISNQLAQA